MQEKNIRDHWDSRAISESYKASWEDYYMLQKEIDEISKHINGHEYICDFGCNNGFTDFQLLSTFNNIKIDGIDYSEELIKKARETLNASNCISRVNFYIGDILKTDTYPDKRYDIVLAKRTLINLENSENQIVALSNLKKILKEDGKIILSEAVEENWERLNRLRGEFGLPSLSQPWHNKYLDKQVIDHIYKNFVVEIDYDYSSSYYIISRAIHPLIKKLSNGNKLEYLSEINRLASQIPNFGDYGTQRIFVLKLKDV